MKVLCDYDVPHEHIFPDDWIFGGSDNMDPAADPRWRGSSYMFIDDKLRVIYTGGEFRCDQEAIDRGFTFVASMSKAHNPVWLRARRPNGREESIPVIYDKQTDEVRDL